MRKQGEMIEQTYYGKWTQKVDSWILMYKEDVEGAGGVMTTVKSYDQGAIIIRTGAIRMRQEFRLGRWTEGKYDGPFGSMLMKTKTERLQVADGRFLLHYRLKLNGEDLGRYELEILMDDTVDGKSDT